MSAVIDDLLRFVEEHPELVSAAVVLSIVTFVGSLVLLPIVVRRLPADHFVGERTPPPTWSRRHPLAWRVAHLGKNLLGGVLLAAGIAMLVLPGQGLLTMFAGLVLLDLPGKRALEQRIVAIDRIRHALDWIRARGGRAPLVDPSTAEASDGSGPGGGVDSRP